MFWQSELNIVTDRKSFILLTFSENQNPEALSTTKVNQKPLPQITKVERGLDLKIVAINTEKGNGQGIRKRGQGSVKMTNSVGKLFHISFLLSLSLGLPEVIVKSNNLFWRKHRSYLSVFEAARIQNQGLY